MILAIDTATPFLVLGLLGEDVALEQARLVERAHAELLAGAVEQLLHEGGDVRPSLIVVGLGPGSYTGLRVGASYALGLGRAWSVPVVGVPTLEAMAARFEDEVAASLDARRGNVYGGVYRVENGIVKDVRLPPQKLPRAAFEERVRGARHVEDEPPGGLALARSGAVRGLKEWHLEYL